MILKLLAIVSLSVLVMTFPVGLFFLWLLRRYTLGLVMVVVPLMCLILLCTSVYRLICVNDVSATAVPTSTQILTIVFLLGSPSLFIYQTWKMHSRNFFEIDFELITMATKALKEHFWVLVLNRVMLLGSMVLVNGPIFTFIWYAFNNGQIVPNFDVVNDPSKGCDNATGYPCCREQSPAWVSAYVALAIFTTFWVLMVTFQLQILVVSSTVADWYFSSTSCSGNIKRSLRNAFGPSFGTACNLGTIIPTMVVAIMGLVKKATNRVLDSSRHGIISSIERGCVSWMSKVLEYNPRFASNFAAISGDNFWEASKKANHLLQRNSLSTTRIFSFMVYYVFTGMTAIYWILQSLVVYFALEYFSVDLESLTAILISMVFCLPVTMIGLGQFHQAIASVMDTVYICYAMEKDVGEISKPEVCHAYTLIRKWDNAPLDNGAMLAPEDKLNVP